MNDLEIKINSQNPVLIGQIVAKLVDTIRKNYKNDLKQVPEYTYLSDKCIVKSKRISAVASRGIISLVETNDLPCQAILEDFVSRIYGNGDLSSVVYVLYNLLLIERKRNLNNYIVTISRHPLVKVLECNSTYATVVLNEIKTARNFEVCIPVYFYIFNETNISELIRQKLWLYILETETCEHIQNILKWMQVSRGEYLPNTYEYLLQYIKQIFDTKTTVPESLSLYTIAVLSESLNNEINPLNITSCIKQILKKDELKMGNNCALYLLSNCITKSPAIYLDDLLSISLMILNSGNTNELILENLKTAVLPWVLYPCFLTEHARKSANTILDWHSTSCISKATHLLLSDQTFLKFKSSNQSLMLAFHACILCESWSNTNQITKWLEEVERTSTTFQKSIFQFLTALALKNFDTPSISVKCLYILLENIRTDKTLRNNLLILLLYKLPYTKNSALHYETLKALPKLAVREENIALVRLTIESLSKGSRVLYTFAMSLMFEIWKVDNRFYSHLEKILAEPQDAPDWEYYVTKSFILKEICSIRPDLYGKDMVPHLSKILNECTSPSQETACVLAIEGIKQLCRSGIIDLITTWNTLSVLYQSETRPLVIQSLCELLEEASIISSKHEKYYKFLEEVVTKLWEFVTMSNHVEVIGGALKALACFNLEDISRHLPDIYRVEEQPSDGLLSENAPGFNPIKFLENGNYHAMREMGDFLISLIHVEVRSYTKRIYNVSQQQREPLNYKYLPLHSIVRAIGTYLQNKIGNWKGTHKPIYLECLRIFSEEYSKPLPPFTWSFLQELVHEPEARHFCVTIACHQVMLSGTARRLIENFLVALTEVYTNDDDILLIYRNLKFFCNSIQPIILRPFLEKSANCVLTSNQILPEIIQCLKAILTDENIQEANKQVVSELILNNVEEASKNDETIFSDYISCLLLLPQQIEQISSLKNYKKPSLAQFRMCVKIRCMAIAGLVSKTPLDLLNELFSFTDDKSKKTIVLEEINSVLKNQTNKVINSTWIMDLLGKIQTMIADKEQMTLELELFFDVLILSVVVFSGLNVFLDHFDFAKLGLLFPTALSAIVKTPYFNHETLQIIEWLHYIVQLQFLPEFYRILAYESLINLREENDFRRNWKKYISNEFLFNKC